MKNMYEMRKIHENQCITRESSEEDLPSYIRSTCELFTLRRLIRCENNHYDNFCRILDPSVIICL
jgi:hypothetical protein